MNPLNLFRRQASPGSHPQAHMTFASSVTDRSMTRAGLFLKKRLWIWPIIAVVLLSVVGFLVRGAIESTMKSNLASELQTLLNVEAAMLETWYGVQASNAESLANDMRIRELVYQLLDRCQTGADSWSIDDGDAWWWRHERGVKGSSSTDSNNNTVVLDRTIDSQNAG